MDTMIEEIRAEIERQKEEAAKEIEKADTFEAITHYRGEVTAYFTLGAFIDKLLKEHSVPSDVEEAAEMAARRKYPYEGVTKGAICEAKIPIYREGFIAGAELQRERMMKEAREHLPKGCETLADTIGFAEGVKLGRRLERQDLMKKAVKGTVLTYTSSSDFDHFTVTSRVPSNDFTLGEEVLAIIIKKEK